MGGVVGGWVVWWVVWWCGGLCGGVVGGLCGGLCGGVGCVVVWWVIWGDKQPSNSQPIGFLEPAWPCKCGLMLAELALDSINKTSLNFA